MKKTTPQLIKNIVGQLEGIERMIEKKEDCFKVIVQMRATKSALGNVMDKFIQENFVSCTSACQNKKEKDKMEKLINELIKK